MNQTEMREPAARGRIWKYRVCRCCGRPLSAEDCPVCGFPRAGELNDAFLVEETERPKLHRQKTAEALKDISLRVFDMRWNAETEAFEQNSDGFVRLADGADCFERTVWSDLQIAQSPEETIPEMTLQMKYTFGDREIPMEVDIQPVRCDDFWRVGLRLNPDFSLDVYLGTADRYAEASATLL